VKPRPWPRCFAAFPLAALAAAAVLALTMAAPGPASAQSVGGWKRGHPKASAPPEGLGAGGSTGRTTAGDAAPIDPLSGSAVFFSNLGLLESISREAATAIVDSLKLSPGSAVTLYASTPHAANWFVGNILGETLAERGYKVRILEWPAPPKADSAGSAASTSTTQTRAANPLLGAGGQNGQNGQNQRSTPPGADSGKEATASADSSTATPDSTQAGADSNPDGPGAEPAKQESPGESAKTETPGTPAPAPPAEAKIARPGNGALPASASTVPAGELLDLRVVEFGVSYSDVGRKLLFGPVRFTRVGGVFMQVSSMSGPQGDLRQVVSAERHRVDRLSGSQRALAEGASYPFDLPELKSPGLGRYIEPTVVVGIVGSLVYLFYANQSSK
jgi:hypothetical protein